MKQILILFFVILGFNCASLTYADYDSISTLEDVRQTPNLTKQDIFTLAKDYFARKQLDAKGSEQIADIENGRIITNASIQQMYMTDRTSVEFKLLLDIKDFKYRLTWENPLITQFNPHQTIRTRVRSNSFWNSDAEQYKENFKEISESLFKHITAPKKDF